MKTLTFAGVTLLLSIAAVTSPALAASTTATPGVQSTVTIGEDTITAYVG